MRLKDSEQKYDFTSTLKQVDQLKSVLLLAMAEQQLSIVSLLMRPPAGFLPTLRALLASSQTDLVTVVLHPLSSETC